MEYNLRRTHYVQPSIGIHVAHCPEGFHHCLLIRFHPVGSFYDHIAVLQYGVHVPIMALAAGTQVPAVVCPYRTQGFLLPREDPELPAGSHTLP